MLAAAACLVAAMPTHGQVEMEKPLHLTSVQGVVVNSAGKPLVGAAVTLDQDGKTIFATRTDKAGEFHFDHVQGHYVFHVARTQYAPAVREIDVGFQISTELERKKLYVIVGPGACEDACSAVLTSKHEFEKELQKKNRH